MHGCITMNLSKLFYATRVLYCFLPKSSIIEAGQMDKIWDTNFSNLLESGCTLSDTFSSDPSGNHQFQDTHGKIELFARMLHRIASRGQPLAVGVTLCDLAKEMGCEKNSPIDIEWSRIHEAKVHVFSHSAPRLGKGSPSMPDLRFAQMWKERLEHYRHIAKRIEWKDTSIFFVIFSGNNKRDHNIDD